MLVLLPLAGCALTPTPPPTTSSGVNPNDVTGNWQASVSAATGSAVTSFAGSFTETKALSGAGQYTMALMQFQGPCFIAAPLLPLQGNITQANALVLDSYTVNGQNVHIAATASGKGSAFTGSYSVQGGCADGAKGMFTAARYAPLTGTYTGTVSQPGSAAVQAVVTLNQAADPTGSGTFLLTGTLTLAGTGCALKAAAVPAAANAVHGNSAALVLNATDGSGAVASLTGTFNVAADAFTPSALSVRGGGCAGSYTGAALAR